MKPTATISVQRRKKFGQYFSGPPLAKLLSHLAVSGTISTILDPMAGDGDLLEASFEAAKAGGSKVSQLDGIEIDEPFSDRCSERLRALGGKPLAKRVISGDAFDEKVFSALSRDGYDLVIANPPYVRKEARKASGINGSRHTREGLRRLLAWRAQAAEQDIWSRLIDGYSGLADLSIPSFLLAAMMVRPGGTLALVMPTTWRSRQYADVMRYALLRFFHTSFIVEDVQPGWFPGANIRTNLIVAKRLESAQAEKPLRERERWASTSWIRIESEAASSNSLVGTAFRGKNPEQDFALWARKKQPRTVSSVSLSAFDQSQEWINLRSQEKRKAWLSGIEGATSQPISRAAELSIPDALRDLIPSSVDLGSLARLGEAGIDAGQGLRTGCNAFFYVTELGRPKTGSVKIRTAKAFGEQEFLVPEGALIPVLRRQADTGAVMSGHIPDSRILFLRNYILPADKASVTRFTKAYATAGIIMPKTMPARLTEFVEQAALTRLNGSDILIPQLSAVRTNSANTNRKVVLPRFWYMLPDLMKRHLPNAFVARVNHGLPWVEVVSNQHLAVDANFTTLWHSNSRWSGSSIKALMNSVWCRTFMEAYGTRFGGGALKLEAAHVREICIPKLSNGDIAALHRLGLRLTHDATTVQAEIDAIVVGAALRDSRPLKVLEFSTNLQARSVALSIARQRAA